MLIAQRPKPAPFAELVSSNGLLTIYFNPYKYIHISLTDNLLVWSVV